MGFKKILSATTLGLMIPGSCLAMEDSTKDFSEDFSDAKGKQNCLYANRKPSNSLSDGDEKQDDSCDKEKQTGSIEVVIKASSAACDDEYNGNYGAIEKLEELGYSIDDIGYFNDSKAAVCTQGWHNKALVFFSEYEEFSGKTAKIDYIINTSNLSLDDLILAIMLKFENECGYNSVIINTKDIESCDLDFIKKLGFEDSGDIYVWHKPAKK